MIQKISDEFLLETYAKSLISEVDSNFIDLLQEEISRRLITSSRK
ncbi:sporulation histidine kinase inhibitor Sda [Neobacillus niacini]|nr:hypothetical protein [Neobacillus niacini]